jgi:Membrane protein involved in the export of O-antigen and teichoic acid
MGLVGALAGLAVAAAAAPLERALAMPGLAPVLLGFAAVTACGLWATVPRALLERHLAYRRVALVEAGALLAALLGFGVALLAGLGIAALVAFHVLLQAVRAIGFTGLARGLAERGGRLGAIAPLLRVGGWVFMTNLLGFAARNLDRFLIGAVLGAAALGLYGLAYQFMTLPLMLISWPASGVLMATLSRMEHDAPGRAEVVCAVFTATATAVIPLMAFLAFGTRYPVGAFLSPQWAGLAELIAVLAPVGAVQAIAAYNGAVLVARGRVRLNFLLGLLNGVALCAAFAATVWLGLAALVRAYAVVALLVSAVMVAATCRAAGIDGHRFARCLLPGALASAAGLLAAALGGGFEARSTAGYAVSALAYLAAVVGVVLLLRGRLLASLRVLVHTRVASAPR